MPFDITDAYVAIEDLNAKFNFLYEVVTEMDKALLKEGITKERLIPEEEKGAKKKKSAETPEV